MGDIIDEVFASGGVLSRSFGEEYEVRRGQMGMARAWNNAIEDGDSLLAEGSCGVGKSFSYLIPATYHSSRWRKPYDSDGEDHTARSGRVVVATANISLQEQLVNKDLPALQDVLPWDFTYALLKGRSNYLCMSKVIGGELQDAPGSREDRVRLLNWSDTTDTGDKSELDFDTGPMWGYCSSRRTTWPRLPGRPWGGTSRRAPSARWSAGLPGTTRTRPMRCSSGPRSW
jgi:ATP-dependent DNA helicase DinG